MARATFSDGPNVDGKGMKGPKATTPGESVQGSAATNVPGGESKKGTWIEMEGPEKSDT